MAKRKTAPKMQAWLKFGYACRKTLGIRPFKKSTPAQKKRLEACVMQKARGAGMKIGKY
jgi:hypothetical protein